ncbi:MAG: hypothetical protein AB9919_02465 [Geobacteraceae bacterium]
MCTYNPSEYLAGFPWHPHRGIETIVRNTQEELRTAFEEFQNGTFIK